MKRKNVNYAKFVEHPRYGRGPRYTDVQPAEAPPGYHPTTCGPTEIEGTGIEADLQKQSFSVVPVLYYFDRKCHCVDCGRPFLFFAEEQKYWYETLGFVLEADCRRCIDCRKRQHRLKRQRRRYELLVHRRDRTVEENLEMADCSLSLMESGVFHVRQTQRVRMTLNRIPDDRRDDQYNDLRRRLLDVEAGNAACDDSHSPRSPS